MALVATLAKVAVGYARTRGMVRGDEDQRIDPDKAGEMLDRARQGREQAQQLVTDLKDGKGKERLRDLARTAAQRRNGPAEEPEQTDTMQTGTAQSEPEETGPSGVTLESVSEAEAELGADAMMTALSGAAAETGQSVGDLLDAYNAGSDMAEVEHSAALLLRTILMAAKADGEIDSEERAVILDSLGDSPDPQDRALVQDCIAAPVDVLALARDTPPGQIVQVYTAAMMAIRLDTPPEAVFLHQLAEALRLDSHVVNALHAQMGRPLLYRSD